MRWLCDHTEMFRAFLKLMVLTFVVSAFFGELQSYLSPAPAMAIVSFATPASELGHGALNQPKTSDQTSVTLLATFGAASCLGAASLLFQFICRQCQRATSVIFFGLVGLLMLLNLAPELRSSGLRADMGG